MTFVTISLQIANKHRLSEKCQVALDGQVIFQGFNHLGTHIITPTRSYMYLFLVMFTYENQKF